MNTQFRVSLSFEVSIDLDMTEQDIRYELGSEGSEPLPDEDVEFYIRHYLDPEFILESGLIQTAIVTHVEVKE